MINASAILGRATPRVVNIELFRRELLSEANNFPLKSFASRNFEIVATFRNRQPPLLHQREFNNNAKGTDLDLEILDIKLARIQTIQYHGYIALSTNQEIDNSNIVVKLARS